MMNEALLANLTVSVETLAKYANVLDSKLNELDLFEDTKTRILKRQLVVLQQKPNHEQSKIHHEFAARYMPRLVERFKSNSGAYNSSMVMLNVICFTSYFVRYLRSPAGQGLAAIQAKRMVETPPDSYDMDIIGEICQFLSTLLALQGAESVNEADRKALIPKLKRWQRSFPGSFASTSSDRCLGALTDSPQMRVMSLTVKNMLEKPLMQCGAEGCEVRLRPTGGNLMQCGRCKTALYCGPQHQKEAWASHRPICFPPSF